MPATKDGLHIRFTNRRIGKYVLYELYDKDNFICAGYGGAAILMLGLLADRLHGNPIQPTRNGLDWILQDTTT